MAHREVMERAARGPRTALPSHTGCSEIPAAGRTTRRKSCMRGSGSTAGGH